MTTSDTKRTPALQLQLPLSTADAPGDDRPAPDWRLDDETRRLGRRGIAAARACLDGRPSGAGSPAGRGRRPGSRRAA